MKTFLLLLLFISNSFAQDSLFQIINAMKDSVSSAKIAHDIKQLEYAGGHYSRVMYTPGNDSAFLYIKNIFESIEGLAVSLDTFLISGANVPYNAKKIFNVVATIKGKDTTAGSYIIGAHYDCSGSRMGSSTWNQQWNTMHAKGADDNASGVAALFEIARLMCDTSFHFKPFYNIKLIAFNAEEYGVVYPGHHVGSIAHAQRASAAGELIHGMISLDMIGYNNNYDYTSIVSNTASQFIGQKFLEARNLFNINLTMNNQPFPEATYSDHESFWQYGYKAILIIENAPPWTSNSWYQANPFYHTTGDSFSTLNMSLIKKVAQLNLAAIASFAAKLNVTNVYENVELLPDEFVLYQNYPNPFNPETVIYYSIPEEDHITISVYDILGREIKKIVNEVKFPGNYSVTFNANDLSSGVYFYELKTKSKLLRKKMVLIR